jgi:hypothetical protein
MLRELVQREIAVQLEPIARGFHEALAELRDELYDNAHAINRRIDAVHTRALRELTRLQSKGAPR